MYVYDTLCVFSDGIIEDPKQQGSLQLKMILEYLECPQYLRKALFRKHGYLEYAGQVMAAMVCGVLWC